MTTKTPNKKASPKPAQGKIIPVHERKNLKTFKDPDSGTIYKIEVIAERLRQKKEVLKSYDHMEAVALKAMQAGVNVPGFDYGQAYKNTQWVDGLTPAKIFQKLKKWVSSKENLMTEPTLKSPAQVKAYIAEDLDAMSIFDSLTERKENGYKVVYPKK